VGTHFTRALIGVAAMASLAVAPGRTRTAGEGGALDDAVVPTTLPCPARAREVSAGTPLQAAVDDAPTGAVLCLAAGRHAGPVEIRKRLILQGPADAVLVSDGSGTTLRVLADSAILLGFTVSGSGRRYDRMDAGVHVRGRGIQVRHLTVEDALFGIIVEQSDEVTVVDNHVIGLADLPVGVRGDGIRLWEVRKSLVRDNHLESSRDILVWYSPGNRIVGNTVEHSRYGTHFMYSDSCAVEDADYRENIVGVFVMYSHDITLRHNRITGNTVVDGMGLGAKESGNLVVEANDFIQDRSCLYLDRSPYRAGDTVVVRGNTFAGCSAGVTFHSSESRNTFVDNTFRSNQTQVTVEGRGTARGVAWLGNYFDDYQGYDLDGDGIGDVAYELRDLSETLVSRHPELAFFRGTIAFELLDVAARVFPLLQPETLLTDPSPRMSAPGAA